MSRQNACVAVFNTHTEAEEAVRELQRGGFDMTKLSIVGKDCHTEEHVVGYYNAGDRMKYWGKLGAFWGGLWGFIFGAAFFWVPGVGPLVMAGPVVSWLVGALEGAVVVGGLSALGAALYSVGIPKDSVVEYETALRADKYLLLAHGSTDEIQTARDTFQAKGAQRVDVHETEEAVVAGGP